MRFLETLVYCTISLIAMQGCRTDTEYTKSLGYSSVCYVTSRIGWVSLKGIFSYIDVDVILGNCTIPFVIRILTKDQPPPSNLVIYSTMQCSTVEIMILYHNK